MTSTLDPLGNAVRVGRSTLRTPGMTGVARAIDTGDRGRLRAQEMTTDALEDALAAHSMLPQETIEIAGAREERGSSTVTRSTSTGEPAIVLETPDPGPDFGQLVLAQDESGVLTWNLPRTDRDEVDVTRGGRTLTYVIRRHVPPAAPMGAGQSRGLIGAVGKKVLKVLAFPLVERGIGAVAEHYATAWEKQHRPYGLRSVTPDNFAQAEGGPVPEMLWHPERDARALLLVHGTFSRIHSGFGGLDHQTVAELDHHYAGRVFGFDHVTLSEDPKRNVERFVQMMPEGASLDLDIVCHSRGGLVSRVLAEQQSAISLGSRAITIRQVVFIATPNAGTALADFKHLGELVDRYTSILNLFPDNGVTNVLETIITVVKHLAVGALSGLPGLTSMTPGGPYLAELNQPSTGGTFYRALAADYEPANAGLQALVRIRDAVTDRVFSDAGNDLVVPSAGVYDANGASGFPIDARHTYAAEEGVQHSGFFRHADARRRLLAWLTREAANGAR